MSAIVAVGGCAALVTWLATFFVRRLAWQHSWVVQPTARGVHDEATATLGGIAMYLAFLASVALASQIPRFDAVFANGEQMLGVVLAATVILAVGVLDDLREVSAPAKASGQVFAGSVLYFLGVSMLYFRIPFADFIVLGADLVPLVTVLWVLGMANAINFIDGLDGLAAGIVAIAPGAFYLYTTQLAEAGLIGPENLSGLLSVILVGMCVGFLPHNFHPAKIFMGDSGAMLLGLLLAASTMLVGGRTVDQFSGQTYFFFAPLFIPLFILGVPIFDVALAIGRRATKRAGVATADKDHIHHRLMALGHGQQRSVMILWMWTALLSGFVLYPTFTGTGNAMVPFAVAALALILFTALHPGVPRGRRRRRRGSPQSESVG